MLRGFTVYRYSSFKVLANRYHIPRRTGIKDISKILNKVKPDRLDTHTRFYISHIIVALLARRKKIELFHYEHGSSLVQDGGLIVRFIATVYDYTLGRLLIRMADKVYGTSYAAKEFSEKVLKAKTVEIQIIPPIISWAPNERMPKDGKYRILFLGRVEKSKGIFELINAIEILKNTTEKKIHLDIVGFGSALEEVKEMLSKKDLEDVITIHGGVQKTQIGKFYSKADIFVLPSYTEGLPLTLLEAILSKNVCIVTNVGDMGRVVKEDAYILPIEKLNGSTLAEKIELVMKSYPQHKKYFEYLRKTLVNETSK